MTENKVPPARALDGIKVVEAATVLAAPLAGMLLADHGADVIKLEMPHRGDPIRYWGHSENEQSSAWKMISRNKRLITLDLHAERGRDLLIKLLADADIFIENFRPGTLARWGLSTERIFEINPQIVVLSFSGFGQTGPYAERPGFGTLAEAFSGFAYINGWEDRPPSLPPFGLADSIAGITGAYGALAALHLARQTGRGQVVDTSLYEPILTTLGSMIIDYDQLGIVQRRQGNSIPFMAPRNAYKTLDAEWVVISAGTDSMFRRLVGAIEKPELASDERFSTNGARVRNSTELDKVIASWIEERSKEDVLTHLQEAEVTVMPVYSAADIVADPHVSARGSLTTVQDEDLKQVTLQSPIPRLSDTPGSIEYLGGALGRDNEDVYRGIGLGRSDIEELRNAGVI